MMTDVESDLVERKESLRGDAPNGIRQAVCAFANDLPDHRRPGLVFVGTRDDGSPGGPYGAVTAELFGRPGILDYRSPLLAEAVRVRGLVQRSIRRMISSWTEIGGNPAGAQRRTGRIRGR